MPITRKQFELGINDPIEEAMKLAHSFLADNRDRAFSQAEIGRAIGIRTPDDLSTLEAALGKLVALHAAHARRIGPLLETETYYAYAGELEI
jgi:hypothetical protein